MEAFLWGLLYIPSPPEVICGQMIVFTVFTIATGTEVVLVPKAVGTARLEVQVWVECGRNKLDHMAFMYIILQ